MIESICLENCEFGHELTHFLKKGVEFEIVHFFFMSLHNTSLYTTQTGESNGELKHYNQVSMPHKFSPAVFQ